MHQRRQARTPRAALSTRKRLSGASLRTRGFTLVELLIVLAIIAIIAAIAVPRLMASKVAANEVVASASLRVMVAAQLQCQKRKLVDSNTDGEGEAGTIAELSGGRLGRLANPLTPALLGASFRAVSVDSQGRAFSARSGYFYRVYLPSEDPTGAVGEDVNGNPLGPVDETAAATTWCAYAWPADYGRSGRRTFFVNQAGEVLTVDCPAYNGRDRGPAPDAAFRTPGTIEGSADIGGRGNALTGTWVQSK